MNSAAAVLLAVCIALFRTGLGDEESPLGTLFEMGACSDLSRAAAANVVSAPVQMYLLLQVHGFNSVSGCLANRAP